MLKGSAVGFALCCLLASAVLVSAQSPRRAPANFQETNATKEIRYSPDRNNEPARETTQSFEAFAPNRV